MAAIKLALDNGYGSIKGKDNKNQLKFPSSVSFLKSEIIENKKIINFENKKFEVGEDALRNSLISRNYSFIYKNSPIFIYEMLRRMNYKFKKGDEVEVDLNTGLSLYDIEKGAEFDQDAKNRGEEYKKRLQRFIINDVIFKCNVKLYAQGQGIWHQYCLENGYVEGYDVAVDIGFRTNDVAIFKNKSPDKRSCGADNKGINVIVQELQSILNKKYDIDFTEQETVKILQDKKIKIFGVEKDMSEIIANIVENFIDSFMNYLSAKYGSYLKIADRVIIAGGGAYIIKEYAKDLPSNIVFPEKDLEFYNVQGYFNG
jgi:plasmid segregation protein ParM